MKNLMNSNLLKLVTLCIAVISTVNVMAQDQFGGLALYTVRNEMGTDAKATLKSVADTGYKNVEAAGYRDGKYYDMTPQDFNAYLKELNLNPVSTHQSAITLDNADVMFADAKAAGFEYFVVPIPPMGMFKYFQETQSMGMEGGPEKLADILTTLGKKCHEAGMKLLYHNHDFEFKKDKNGLVVIDYLLENTDPEYVNFQMDLYWVTKAGADPLAYFEKYPDRFKLWHVKDMDDQGRFTPVGNGTIDFGKILKEKELSGMKYYFVEQDRTFNMKPMEAIKVSHDALKKIGFQ
ncbi:MAG: sugar phosphate isomerase/epimerase [Flavobacteriales bacterium]|nr:sugar phosphate isomerase/epimerase [Flavobacteriales bacterium]